MLDIERSSDWYLLKLTEELGELTAEHLLLGGSAKPNADGSGGTREALENEATDLFGQFVVYLRANEIAALWSKCHKMPKDPELLKLESCRYVWAHIPMRDPDVGEEHGGKDSLLKDSCHNQE